MQAERDKFIDTIFNIESEKRTDYFFTDNWDQKSMWLEIDAETNPDKVLNLLHSVFSEYNTWVHHYSPVQITLGIEAIFNPCLSNLGFCFQGKDVKKEKAVQAIRSFGDFFLSVFEQYAPTNLCHLGQSTQDHQAGVISHMVYMFWDTAPIPHQCSMEVRSTCLDVMRRCTMSTNIAIVESGLHGLGHAVQEYGQEYVRPYFTSANITNNTALKSYAAKAMVGNVL